MKYDYANFYCYMWMFRLACIRRDLYVRPSFILFKNLNFVDNYQEF